MNASLTLNKQGKFALFYDEPLGVVPEWASIDIERGEIYIGGANIENKAIKLDKIDDRIYARVKKETEILLVLVKSDGAREPLETLFIPLMVSQQI